MQFLNYEFDRGIRSLVNSVHEGLRVFLEGLVLVGEGWLATFVTAGAVQKVELNVNLEGIRTVMSRLVAGKGSLVRVQLLSRAMSRRILHVNSNGSERLPEGRFALAARTFLKD